VSYHEAFWVVTGTAAPVIALAAVVALPDTSAMTSRTVQHFGSAWLPTAEQLKTGSELWTRAAIIKVSAVTNLVAQACLLLISLMALMWASNPLSPWVAVAIAVGGILLLAWTLSAGSLLRRTLDSLDTRSGDD
jgi:uncharacterized membrane protein